VSTFVAFGIAPVLPQNDADDLPATFAAGVLDADSEADEDGEADGDAEADGDGETGREGDVESDGTATTDGSAWAEDTGSATSVRGDGAHPATAVTTATAQRLNRRTRTGAAWRTPAPAST
jgi:hypothetical protein